MNINDVIKYPVLSEKSYQQMSNGIYTFAVDFRTNKVEVKKVIEYIFDVKVEKVNIMSIDKKAKKVGKFKGFTNRYKKAIVTLKKGNIINIFPEELEKQAKEKTKKETSIKKEVSEVEKKAAAKIAKKEKTKVKLKKEIKIEDK